MVCLSLLIEQWLEDVVISPVDQNDFGVAPSKRSRGCNSSEASADNHDPRRRVPDAPPPRRFHREPEP